MDDAQVLAIGRLTIAAGQLEMVTYSLARVSVGGSYRVFEATAGTLSFEQLAALVSRVLVARDLLSEDARKWLSGARSLMTERNAVLHGIWEGETLLARRSSPRVRVTSADDLEELTRRFSETCGAGNALIGTVQKSVGRGGR